MPPRPIQPTRGRSLGAWDSEAIVRASVNQDGSSTLPTVAAAEDFSKSRRVVLRMDRLPCKDRNEFGHGGRRGSYGSLKGIAYPRWLSTAICYPLHPRHPLRASSSSRPWLVRHMLKIMPISFGIRQSGWSVRDFGQAQRSSIRNKI